MRTATGETKLDDATATLQNLQPVCNHIVNLGHPLRFLARQRSRLLFGVLCLLLTNAAAQAIPWVIKRTIEAIGSASTAGVDRAQLLTILVAALAVAQAVIRVLSRTTLFNAGREAEYELRRSLFSQLCRLDRGFYQQFRTGDLMSRLTNDLAAVRSLFGPGVLYAVNTVFAYAVALPLMLKIHPTLTLWALLPYPLLLAGARSFARGIYSRSHDQQVALATMTSSVQEDLAGIRELKSYRLEQQRAEVFRRTSEDYLSHALRLAAWRTGMMPFVGAGAGISLVLILWLGGRAVMAGTITLGDLVALNLYVGLLAWPTMAIGWMLSVWQRGLAAWERLGELLRRQPQLADTDGHTQLPDRIAIDVRNLDVRLGKTTAIRNVSFHLAAGSLCAVVGRVGSGKSTLAEAIGRLLPIPDGTIHFGGVDVTTASLGEVRRHIAYAPQDAFLFSQTLRENILLGIDDIEQLTAEQQQRKVTEAAQLAGLEDDLAALPAGLDTLVGEQGISLSGGQRQRVALARALVSARPLLILDDSLSAVDAETEERILARLRQALRDTTTVLTSHRLSALQHADQILVLAGGEIVERGTHSDLMAANGHYTKLYQRQLLRARHGDA